MASLVQYAWLSLKKIVIPHPFSWFIWTFCAATVCVAQYVSNAGPGAIVTAFTTVGSAFIMALSLISGRKIHVKPAELRILFSSILACVMWALTANPLYAVLLITIADTLGYYSTLRKVYLAPFSESISYYYLAGIKFVPSLFIFDSYSFTNLFFPISMVFVNFLAAICIAHRRRVLKRVNYQLR